MATKTSLTVVEGPNGNAELFEVADDGSTVATEYQVEFKGQSQTYQTMGEAYIEAGVLAGTQT
jgi:hypothetical protein